MSLYFITGNKNKYKEINGYNALIKNTVDEIIEALEGTSNNEELQNILKEIRAERRAIKKVNRGVRRI